MRTMLWPITLLFLGAAVTASAQNFSFSRTTIVTPLPAFSGDHAQGVAASALTSSGSADVVLVTGGSPGSGANGAVVVLPGKGDGTFKTGVVYSIGTNVNAPLIANLDAGGLPDVAISSNGTSVLFGNGDTSLQTAAKVSAPFSTTEAAGDFNGDGKLDLAIGLPDQKQVGVLIGNGDKTFKPLVTYQLATGPTTWVGTADFDDLVHDNKLDLVTTNYLDNSISVLLGKGDGTFEAPVNFSGGPGVPGAQSGVIADFNGDGHMDVAMISAGIGSAFLSVFLGKGDGTFQTAVQYPLSQRPVTVVAADFDLDGRLDLAIAGGSIVILRGKGDGTFETPVTIDAGQGYQLAVADFNKDGRPDLAVAIYGDPGNATAAILINTGLPAPRTISHIADGASFRTTFILLNTGATAANFTLDFWSDTGGPLTLDLVADGVTASLSGVIPPHGARFIRTAGTTAGLNKGWAQLTAPDAVDGNAIFGSQSPGKGDSEAAVPLSPGGGTDLFLPFDDTPGLVTGVAFADPGQQAATIAGSFVDDAGTAIADASTVNVPKHGHNADVLPTFFPATQGKRGAAHFKAGTNIFGLGIRANGKAFTTIEALSGVTAAAKIIAHIASGGGWKTTFLLVNTGIAAAQFTLDFFGDHGAALLLPLDTVGTVSTLTGTIPPGGLRLVKATNTGTLVTGRAQLTVTGAISGTAIFALETAGQADSEAAVPFLTQGSTQLYMPFDYSSGYSTGIALANANQAVATVTATFFDEAGNSLTTPKVVPIPALGHISAVLADAALFPGIAGKRGTVALTSDHPISGLGIRANGPSFTSLKVVAK